MQFINDSNLMSMCIIKFYLFSLFNSSTYRIKRVFLIACNTIQSIIMFFEAGNIIINICECSFTTRTFENFLYNCTRPCSISRMIIYFVFKTLTYRNHSVYLQTIGFWFLLLTCFTAINKFY